ncbi:class I glutamine amidotransferase-like protein [Jaminaea rosea]|uniref:Class I glutamine amidotransferase-like protein n=1 Tax=Jaminaea rosea TaxID=1569628 RepID=A0A316URC4_9BASI|nr:class I glutamine amidotransferase-like protein [Jaminaea rosea]PWN27524.1 class I glutamine amidotransferase-like protein [Jaminaea rosea]
MYALPSLFLSISLIACVAFAQDPSWPTILLFTHTAGYRHEAIPTAISTITSLGNGSLVLSDDNVDSTIKSGRWNTNNSEDATLFNDVASLKQYDAIVFAFTTDVDPPGVGSLLNDDQTANLLEYIEQGGSFAGIHSATNCLYSYPAYGRLVGAFFTYHAQSQRVTLKPTTRDHPSTSKLPDTLTISEEMYHLRTDPRKLPSPATALLTNASAYPDPGGQRGEGNPQPLAWYRSGSLLTSGASALGGDLDGQTQCTGGGGKTFVTTLGHEIATWNNAAFQGHIQGGIGWLLSVSANDGTAVSTNGGSSSSSSSSPSQSSTSSDETRSSPSSASHLGASVAVLTAALGALFACTLAL